MKRFALALVIALVAGCGSPTKAPPPSAPALGDSAIQRLLRDTLAVERAKADTDVMSKNKRLTAPQSRDLRTVVNMADEAVQSARHAYFAGNLALFESLMGTVGELLREFTSSASSAESERRAAEAERAHNLKEKRK